MRRLRLIIAGYGTVAKAFLEIVEAEGARIAEEHGVRLEPVAVVRASGAWIDAGGLRPEALAPRALQQKNVMDVLAATEAEVLVELTPTDLKTGGVALEHVRTALERGLHVVTANKGPAVMAMHELEALARKHDRMFRYEATVAAAVPLVSLQEHCLRGERVTRIDGVLNGTSNYILSRMGEEGMGFEEALQEAQARGYAEADPSADVDGLDAAAKIVILANRFLGMRLGMDDVRVEGIRSVTGEAVQLAVKQGYVVRLVASASRGAAGGAAVMPRLVPLASPLNVQGTLNVVRLARAFGGPVSLTGHGAGGRETAAAVLADLLSVAAAQGDGT